MKIGRTEDIGALVRDRRRALGLNQSMLASRIGSSQDWVSRLEAGKPTLQIGLVLRALKEVGVVLTADAPEAALTSSSPEKRSSARPRISLKDIVDG